MEYIGVLKSGFLGTETPYLFYPMKTISVPKGYRSFYINHLGRHGARYLSSSTRVETLLGELEKAKTQKQLTERGKRLRKQIEAFKEATAHQYGLLTPLGKEEEYRLGMRLYQRFPDAFGRKVQAVSTSVKRAQQSMFSFLNGLGEETQQSLLQATINGPIDPILRFYDLNEAYLSYKKEGAWHQMLKDFKKRSQIGINFLECFFEKTYIKQMADPITFGTYIYDLYTNTFNMQVDLGLGSYFDKRLLSYYWENENLQQYLEKGPGIKGEDLQTNMAFALLENFIATSDTAIKEGDISANLRFAHAETLMPMLSLMKLACCGRQTDDLSKVASIWKDYTLAQMGANMWWVFFKGRKEQPIVMMMFLDEQPVRLPLQTYYGTCYLWEDVKSFYKQEIQKLHIPKSLSLVDQVKNYHI